MIPYDTVFSFPSLFPLIALCLVRLPEDILPRVASLSQLVLGSALVFLLYSELVISRTGKLVLVSVFDANTTLSQRFITLSASLCGCEQAILVLTSFAFCQDPLLLLLALSHHVIHAGACG